MVSSFSNPGFPPVHTHPPTFSAMVAANEDSLRETLDALFAPYLAKIRRARELALTAEGDSTPTPMFVISDGGVSDPAPLISDDTESIDLGHPGLQGDNNQPRLPSPIEVHSIPPLLSSSPLLQAMATSAIRPQSIASYAARVPTMATAVELLPIGNESVVPHTELQPSHHKSPNGDCNPLRIPSTIHDHSIPPLLSSSPMLRALANSTVKPHSNNSAAATVSLPESKTGIHASTMTSTLRLLHEQSFSDSMKSGLDVVLKLSIISVTSEAKFPSLLTDNYGAYLKDKFGWVNWYLVGKFVRKYFCAWKLFDEIPSSCYVVIDQDICYCNGIRDKGGGSKFHKMQLKIAVAKQMRRDIALLIQSGHNATARIWVEHVFREQKILAANEFIELFCELVVSRIFIIAKQRECLPNLNEGITSLIFASSRCSEISELISLRNIFEEKYGKDFVSAAVDVHPCCGVNCMMCCEGRRLQFVDSTSTAEVASKSSNDAMAAAQVAAYLTNTDCNQDIDIVYLKKIKEASPLSLIVSLRSISEFDEGSPMSKPWIVNLGGSESLAKTEVQGESLKEAQNINKSLSALHGIKLQGMLTSIEDKSKKKNPCVFLAISIDMDPVEQLVIEFFVDDVHQTTGNFRALYTGDKGSTCHRAINGVENNIKCLPSHNAVRNDAMDQEGKGTNEVEPHDLQPIIFELPLLDHEEVNNGVLKVSELNDMAEKVIAVWDKQVAIDGEMEFEPIPVDVLDGHDCVVGESSTSPSFSSGFDESSYLSWVENVEEVSQENYGEATGNKNSLTQFRRATIPGRIIMISKPSSTIPFLSLEDKANFQGGSIVMTQIITEVLCFITVRNC